MTALANRLPLLRVQLTSHVPFVALAWVLFTVVVLVITGILALNDAVSGGILHHVATQAPRWLLFGLGVDVVSTYLRIQLAHGRTRRDFLRQTTLYAVVLSGFTALLVTVGYLLERGYYGLFGWPYSLPGEVTFAGVGQFPAILGTYWLSFLMWTVAGVVVGLGFFRDKGLGVLTIPLGLVIVAPSVALFRAGGLPIVGERLADVEVTLGALLAACAALLAAAVGVAWAIVRDVPMATRV